MQDIQMLTAALDYLQKGYSVIPVKRADKKPLITTWKEFQIKPPTEEQVRGWWFTWPDANIAIITGAISKLVVVDLDKELNFDQVNGWLKNFEADDSFIVKSQRGWHIYFKHPEFAINNSAKIEGYIDLRGDGGYIVAPPSVHASGFIYKIAQDFELAALPKKMISFFSQARITPTRGLANQEVFKEGGRRVALLSLAGTYLKRGMNADEVYLLLLGVNKVKCQPPLKDEQVKELVEDIDRAEARQIQNKVSKLDAVKAVFDKWLYIVDPYWVEITLAAIVANRWKTDPLWLLVVAPPSSAKTEFIESVSGLEDTYSLSSLTPQTFISGMKEKEMSLIYKLNGKTLLLKDFTTLLSMRSDDKAIIFAQLREIYDGKFSKAFGSVKTRFWEGKIGFIAGCTGVIENQMLYSNQMGERCLMYRPQLGDTLKAGMKAAESFGFEEKMRGELKGVMQEFLVGLPRRKVEEIIIPQEIMDAVINLAQIISLLRCTVDRDRYHRTVEMKPAPEGLGRIVKQLLLVIKALCEIRGQAAAGDYELKAAASLAWSNVPTIRMSIVDYFISSGGKKNTAAVAEALQLPGKTTIEHMENLVILGFLERDNKASDFNGNSSVEGRKPYWWWIKKEWIEQLRKVGKGSNMPDAIESEILI